MRERKELVWRDPRFAPYFRGARSLVYQLLRRDPYAGGQTHRLILRACDDKVGGSPAGATSSDPALAPGDRTSYVRRV